MDIGGDDLRVLQRSIRCPPCNAMLGTFHADGITRTVNCPSCHRRVTVVVWFERSDPLPDPCRGIPSRRIYGGEKPPDLSE